MNLDNQLIFFFSALGAFNSVVLSIYFLFFDQHKNKSNYFLGGLLAVLSIRVWKSLFFYFNPDLSKIYLQIGLSACFFIGPFLYFYIKSKTQEVAQSNRLFYVQILAYLLIVLSIGFLYPYEKNTELWGTYFYKIINYQWLLYILIAAFILRRSFQKMISKKEKLGYDEVWSLSVFFGVSIIWLAYFTAAYTSYISGALSFSFVFYLSILLLFYKRKKDFVVAVKKEKYSNIQIEENEVKQLLEKITATLHEEKLYKNANLTLPIFAKKLNIRPQLLSQVLNHNLKKSFTQFINEYRVEEVKQLLETHPNLKIEIIAEKCGFNSNSTFYTAFKKVTNTTPVKYIRNK
ncbi:helix-turn-helix domain-containing protein [Polaribacter dokdonensis]|uniref:Transcriptional regulator, AraC family n=1 Tax=Polaribacter dokdonensis DSW-5 TaxID=1300348 RepID=A0A0M9CII0_9FLAO|nr:helix-turn-helix domain-containing protein [Polaribacter dokdonensis]KOY53126.1 Transcriptional regulator, AraC family [Polaribacter dokdonensis DSW-5]SEE57461.1 transcriptional regulator, AraC family [Polaribacter dokdonensis DSW-5]